MADIAAIFHWAPDVMDRMPIEELALWREKAHQRIPQEKDMQ
ncbi:MAG: GpE family phage tail protein [Rhodobacterales bacterium]|nr:MAG: GpE family phage tail protein [Rhodobacterales bacterium]